MRTKEQLLESMKQNKARRIKELERRSPEELVAMLEKMGHFDLVNNDINWLQNEINQGKAN